MTLDAHHCNPETMTQIEQAGGQYLIQVKENQPKLLEYCRDLGKQPSLAETVDYIHLAVNYIKFTESSGLSTFQNAHKQNTVNHLAQAVRGHWGVESNNWQLDVTFGEDSVKTKEGNQALIMGKIRCFCMNLIRWSKKGIKNFQATIKFTDSPETLLC